MLASCDEPLVYVKGGFWTLPSLAEMIGKIGCRDRRYVTMETVKAMERMGLLAQAGSSTNYPIRLYPQLSDRVLTEAGLATAIQGT